MTRLSVCSLGVSCNEMIDTPMLLVKKLCIFFQTVGDGLLLPPFAGAMLRCQSFKKSSRNEVELENKEYVVTIFYNCENDSYCAIAL